MGVAVLELLGDLDSPPRVVEEDNGEAVPEVVSFFFEALLESFALESCSCYTRISDQFTIDKVKLVRHGDVDTYHSCPETFHIVEGSPWI